VEGGEEPD